MLTNVGSLRLVGWNLFHKKKNESRCFVTSIFSLSSLLKSFPKLSTWAVFFFFHFSFFCCLCSIETLSFFNSRGFDKLLCQACVWKVFFFHYYYLFYGQVRLFDSVCCWCRCESSRLESERERENAERNLCCDVNCASLNIGRMGQSDSVKHLSPLSIVFMTFGLAVATPSVPFPLNSPFKIFAIIKD